MFASSRNVQAMKTMLLELWGEKRHLSSVPGTVGETAKVFYFSLTSEKLQLFTKISLASFPFSSSLPQIIESYVSQLHWCIIVAHYGDNHYKNHWCILSFWLAWSWCIWISIDCGELGIVELNHSDTPISALEEELFLQALNDCFTLKWTCLGAHNQLLETLESGNSLKCQAEVLTLALVVLWCESA